MPHEKLDTYQTPVLNIVKNPNTIKPSSYFKIMILNIIISI